jgi:lipopolysaccharide export system protein LptA
MSLSCVPAWAQTNAPAAATVEKELKINSDSFYFDGITNQLVYLGHVFVIYNDKDTLTCERLTVDFPADRGSPTNIVAETNVVVDVLDEKGQTNHITADTAVYSYQLLNPSTNVVKSITNVVYAVTNELLQFTGGNPFPKLERTDISMVSDVILYNIITKKVRGLGTHTQMIYKQTSRSGSGTNASPFELLK